MLLAVRNKTVLIIYPNDYTNCFLGNLPLFCWESTAVLQTLPQEPTPDQNARTQGEKHSHDDAPHFDFWTSDMLFRETVEGTKT